MTRQLALALALAAPLLARSRVDLNGPWRFAIDPHGNGEKNGWMKPQVPGTANWGSSVVVPHCWPVDPRYPYNGRAWYRRSFPTRPDSAGKHVGLTFEAVFYRTRVWLNGELLGTHEGGYTPFEFDVTGRLQPGGNTLALEVDNSWSDATIPGARPGTRPEDQVYPWWDYGGIVRDVYLTITAPVYVSAQRIAATPDLANGTARITTTVWVRNTTGSASTVVVSQQARPTLPDAPGASVTVAPKSTASVELQWPLRRQDVRLWDQDHPNLYRMRTILRAANAAEELDADEALFGIRSIQARGQLLLNGVPVKMGGANRHSDHPRFGLIEPKQVVDADMALMKSANMELARIAHYPVPTALLDWADRNGILIIEQCPIWGNTVAQLESERMRGLFRLQLEEMIRRDWNHPSVIGWSVGNEYQSDRPAGVRWTQEMSALAHGLDPSRLTTLASNHAARSFARPEDEGSHHVDLINVNIYGKPEQVKAQLEKIHARWPERVILISEFGSLDLLTLGDQERVRYVRSYLSVIRTLPYVAGVSLWTFNDYRSRWPQTSGWPQTSEDGYRHFGAVTADRRPTALYYALRAEFSPVVIREVRPSPGSVHLAIAARPDFPSYPVRDYTVRCSWLGKDNNVLCTSTNKLPVLQPGQEVQLSCGCSTWQPNSETVRVEIVRPTGFVITEQLATRRFMGSQY